MGLDMFLGKRTYIGNEYRKDENKIKLENANNTNINANKITYITESVACWRKANAIHGWFVKNVQNGIDNCDDYPVSFDQLKDLLSIVKKVLKSPEKARTLLNPYEGFFFGTYDIDSYYISDLEYTEKILSEIIKNKEHYQCDYFYSSSW